MADQGLATITNTLQAVIAEKQPTMNGKRGVGAGHATRTIGHGSAISMKKYQYRSTDESMEPR